MVNPVKHPGLVLDLPIIPDHRSDRERTNIGTNLDDLRKMRILVVDDLHDNLDLTESMLKKSGFSNILTATSGESALKCLRDHANNEGEGIDIVLLDVMMPKMDGYEVCHRIRTQEKLADIPVVMITANAMWRDDIARSSIDSGATDIIFKPIRRAVLIPRVISALALKKERDLRKFREVELETELAERKVVEARLQYLVSHDDLTGLCNRRSLEYALETAIDHAHNQNISGALLYLDLDQFKVINDLEGHETGDRLLINIANKLQHLIQHGNVLARVSADEYAILINDISETDALKMAETLRHFMDEFQFKTNNRSYHIGASIGVAPILPGENVNPSEILARANQACFVAKTHGRNMVHIFNREDAEVIILRSAVYWVPRIRDALANNKFRLLFQPVINLSTGTTQHYEALIRMTGDKDELITPDKFIPIAERMGLIHDIDLWVVKHAIDVLHQLPAHQSNLSLNINLSSHAFQDPALLPLVRDRLASTGIAANRITFEITETAAVANFEQTREMVCQLRELGCSFALDDFGAGFSSFNYLKQFPVDYLKIDGSFITNLVNDPIDQTLVKSIIEIARTLGKHTVAEFVESAEVLNMLKEYGANYAQGYHIGKPTQHFQTTDLHKLLTSK